LLDELEAAGRLDNAYVVFTSDNGYAFGEHRLTSKGQLYEESIRVPLWVRGPDVVSGTLDRLTTNLDILPTILEWTGVATSLPIDGQSFADDARGVDTYQNRDAVLLFGCRTHELLGNTDCGAHREPMGTAWGLRTERYKYVAYADGFEQVFDLDLDPWERTNLAYDAAHEALRAELRNQLASSRGDASGITGRVTNRDGEGLSGIEVTLRPVGGDWTIATRTHPNGGYGFLILPPGQYHVRFEDPAGAYKRQFFDGAGSVGGADLVTAGYVTGVDASLARR
jgi:hypothetical protein